MRREVSLEGQLPGSPTPRPSLLTPNPRHQIPAGTGQVDRMLSLFIYLNHPKLAVNSSSWIQSFLSKSQSKFLLIIHFKLTEPLLYMWSVTNQNVGMWHVTIASFICQMDY